MKASIMLDGECLDSRIKISTMLMEMDELDKVGAMACIMDNSSTAQFIDDCHHIIAFQAVVHLRDAERKWSGDVLVDLHKAQLMVHQTDYEGAVRVLRSASQKLELEIGDDSHVSQSLPSNQKLATMRHLAPTIAALHGVSEFRVDPENPEVRSWLVAMSWLCMWQYLTVASAAYTASLVCAAARS